MKLSLVIEGLRSDIVAVGELGDEAVAEIADRVAAMFSRSAPSRILDLLSGVAAELSDQIPNGRIEIRLVGDDVDVAYVDEEPPVSESDAEQSSRITLRLSEQLKSRVEESAAREGISVNTYIIRVLERGATSSYARSGRVGSRLRGYGTS
jgi:hypothetical protein